MFVDSKVARPYCFASVLRASHTSVLDHGLDLVFRVRPLQYNCLPASADREFGRWVLSLFAGHCWVSSRAVDQNVPLRKFVAFAPNPLLELSSQSPGILPNHDPQNSVRSIDDKVKR